METMAACMKLEVCLVLLLLFKMGMKTRVRSTVVNSQKVVVTRVLLPPQVSSNANGIRNLNGRS